MKRRNILVVFKSTLLGALINLSLASCATTDEAINVAQSSSLVALLDDLHSWEEQRSPLAELYKGKHVKSISPRSLNDIDRGLTRAFDYQKKLQEVDSTNLNPQDSLSRQIMLFKLEDYIARAEFGADLIPLNAEGGFYNRLTFILGRLPFQTVVDFDQYLTWLPEYAEYLESHIGLLELGLERGRIAPVPVVNNTLSMLRVLKETAFEEHPAMTPFGSMPEAISGSEKQRLLNSARQQFKQQLLPIYQKLHLFFEAQYAPRASQQPGILTQPGGTQFYQNRLEFFTTLPLTPDDVFALGLAEVERIGAAMDKVVQELDYPGDRRQLIQELRTAPEHYPATPQALLERAAWIAKKIEGQLPGWFDPLYELPFTIEPVPAEIAPTYTSGRYLSGDRERNQAGVYWVNTTRLQSRALFNLPALTLHEAVPGHHLQHARTSELQDVHPFRNKFYISAFGEGWGLYAEFLGEEMGIYETPYEQFGRLSYEMWRACRLVVDVGIHDRGWSRAQAIDYLGSRTALSEHEVETEIDRYIGWPGQALAYKLGELTIIGLRREAQKELGERFNVKAFHNAVLGNGALPLQLLIDQVRLALGLSGEGLPENLRSGIKKGRTMDSLARIQ